MRRVVLLGRGGAGKSSVARRLGAGIQADLVRADSWILDGDLGPHDVLDVRLQAADTVLVLDFSLPRCAWRAARRSREGIDFWRWVWGYRRHSRPLISSAIARHAPAGGR